MDLSGFRRQACRTFEEPRYPQQNSTRLDTPPPTVRQSADDSRIIHPPPCRSFFFKVDVTPVGRFSLRPYRASAAVPSPFPVLGGVAAAWETGRGAALVALGESQ